MMKKRWLLIVLIFVAIALVSPGFASAADNYRYSQFENVYRGVSISPENARMENSPRLYENIYENRLSTWNGSTSDNYGMYGTSQTPVNGQFLTDNAGWTGTQIGTRFYWKRNTTGSGNAGSENIVDPTINAGGGQTRADTQVPTFHHI